MTDPERDRAIEQVFQAMFPKPIDDLRLAITEFDGKIIEDETEVIQAAAVIIRKVKEFVEQE